MDQEKIANFIKEIRIKNKLSQAEFAAKYGVTYQAVSKWENARNIPDIAILKEICNDYNISVNDFLEAKKSTKKGDKKIYVILSIVIILISSIALILINKGNDNFEFKTISSTCNNFNLFGSIAYNKIKSSIYISNITYCGGDDNNKYKQIECSLYEISEINKHEISHYEYRDNELITLEDFLKKIDFKVDHYEKTCKIYKKNSLMLEIKAISKDDKNINYEIPLDLTENCQ